MFDHLLSLVEPWMLAALSIGWLIYLVCLVIWIVLQKRPPLSTLSWILSLAALPVLGFFIYFFLGPQKIKRQRRKRAKRSRLASEPPSDSALAPDALSERGRALSRLLRATCGVPLSSAGQVDLLVGGADTFAALHAAITDARSHIHLATYIFEPDGVGLPLLEALTAAARRGVCVRLLVDAVGSPKLRRRHTRALRAAGGKVVAFHPFRLATLRPLLNLRLHRKIAVIDGRFGFLGGVNITQDESRAFGEHAFHDLHLRVEGAVVAWLQTLFIDDWSYASKTPLSDRGLFPPIADGAVAAQIIGSGPEGIWEPIHRLYLQSINHAQSRVWMVTPYFVPGEADLFALSNAALRGVDVRILVPRRSDSLVVTFAARSYFDALLEAGVRIYEYRPTMLHSKALLLDDDCALIGSANFDQRSFRLNFEVCAVIYDLPFAALLDRQFERDFSQSRRLSRPRPVGPMRRLAEACARLLSPLL